MSLPSAAYLLARTRPVIHPRRAKGGFDAPPLHPDPHRSRAAALLRACGPNPRDHLIFSLALGTGLRLAEIVGLDVGDVFFLDGAARARVRLQSEIAKRHRAGDGFLPDALMPRLRLLWAYKAACGKSLAPEAALFCSQAGRRLSRRRVQVLFRAWQVIAGLDRLCPFHALRQTAVTNVYRASRDLFLAQRFARHTSPLTTTVYTHSISNSLTFP